VRKQARDITCGGWVRGGSARSCEAATPPPPWDFKPQHVQGQRAAYAQRPCSKRKQVTWQTQRGQCNTARSRFDPQFLSIADFSSDGDFDARRSSRCGVLLSARPSSPEGGVAQDNEGEGWGGRPSTPDAFASSPFATSRMPAESGCVGLTLTHLDLSGNRYVAEMQRAQLKLSCDHGCEIFDKWPFTGLCLDCPWRLLPVLISGSRCVHSTKCVKSLSVSCCAAVEQYAGPGFARESSEKAHRHA
jgi:hypothetical protein